MKDISEERMLRLLKAAPEEGIRVALNAYGGPVRTICRNILFDCAAEDTEEAVADSFVELWRSVERFDEKAGYSLKSYLYGIARHKALDKRRAMNKRREHISLEETAIEAAVDLEGDYAQKLNDSIVHHTVEGLDEPMRSVFILRYFYFAKIKDIALRLGLTQKAVENHLYRGKDRLRLELVERGIQYE